MMKTSTTMMAAFGLATKASALYMAKQCYDSDAVCFTLNVPESTAQSGTGDIYFQMTAPTTMNWVGLGQGSRMAGSNMFVMYTSSDGQNVTISPRLGINHDEPLYDQSANFTLLGGSSVANGTMTANVKCSNCHSWTGGTMDFTGTTAEWIYGYKEGSEMNTNAKDADIPEHSKYGKFSFNLTEARGGNSTDPFTDRSYVDNIPLTEDGAPAYSDVLVTAHGIVACAAFLLFVLGAMLIRLATFSGIIWVHAAVQITGLLGFAAAVGMGIYMSMTEGYQAHPIIGLVLFGLLCLEPITGLIHHRVFKRTFARNASSWIHLTTGRAVILVGFINGGLGLQLTGQSTAAYIAYGVVAGIIALLYLAVIVFGETKRARSRKNSEQHEPKPSVSGSGSEMEYRA